MSKSIILDVKDISFTYHGYDRPAIQDISFQVKRHHITAAIGKSGCGKTTLLKCVYGLLPLSKGSVSINGREILNPLEKLIPGDDEMRFVSQDTEEVKPYYSVFENLEFSLRNIAHEDRYEEIDFLLQLFELEAYKDQKGITLSGGQRQRLSIAMSIANPPELLILDEPFNQIDRQISDKIFDYLSDKVAKKETSILFVSHQAEDVLKWADQTLVLEDGFVTRIDSPTLIYTEPKSLPEALLLGHAFLYQQNIHRPEDFSISTTGDKTEVTDSRFIGGRYLNTGKTKDGILYFYSDKANTKGQVLSVK